MPTKRTDPRDEPLFDEALLASGGGEATAGEGPARALASGGGEATAGDGPAKAQALAKRLSEHKKLVARVERALKGLGERWRDPASLEKDLGLLRESVAELPEAVGDELRALVELGEAWLVEEREGRRGRLARELKALAAERKITLSVVTRDPLELRLEPLGLSVDLERGRATLHFGRQELARCPVDAAAILEAREVALAVLDRDGWTPESFHHELLEAWRAVARASGGEGWVELRDVLPRLAYEVQSEAWRRDPRAKTFTDYGKARFLYELHRLREAGGLSRGGWRLALGPATGGSTRDKKRVFWVEDAAGRGAYHLTMRFLRDEEIHGDEQ